MNDEMQPPEDPGQGLRIPTTTGPGYQAQIDIHARFDTFDEVETSLSVDGFMPESQPPMCRPAVNAAALNDPDDRRFTELFAATQAWHTYTINYYRRVQAKLLSVTKEKGELGRVIREEAVQGVTKRSDLPKAGELKDMVSGNPRVVELEGEELRLLQIELLMKSHVDSIERDLKTISRLIELRKMDKGMGRRPAGHAQQTYGGQ